MEENSREETKKRRAEHKIKGTITESPKLHISNSGKENVRFKIKDKDHNEHEIIVWNQQTKPALELDEGMEIEVVGIYVDEAARMRRRLWASFWNAPQKPMTKEQQLIKYYGSKTKMLQERQKNDEWHLQRGDCLVIRDGRYQWISGDNAIEVDYGTYMHKIDYLIDKMGLETVNRRIKEAYGTGLIKGNNERYKAEIKKMLQECEEMLMIEAYETPPTHG